MQPAPGAAWRSLSAAKQGLVCAFAALVIWSFWPIWTRHGVTGNLAPQDIVLLRFAVGGLFFLPFLLAQARSISRRAWLAGLGLALCQGAPFVLLMAMGLRFAPANHAASLATGASPLFAALLGAAFFAEPIARARQIGLLLVIVGAAILAFGGIGGQVAAGDALFVAAAAMAAIYIVFVGRTGLTPFQAAAMVSVFSMIVYVPLHVLLGLGKISSAALPEIAAQGAYQGLLVAVASFLLFNGAIARLGPARVSALCALLPVLTIVFAIPVLGEWPSRIEMLSVVLISAGVYLAASALRMRATEEVPAPVGPGAPPV